MGISVLFACNEPLWLASLRPELSAITDRGYRDNPLATRYFSPVAGLAEAGITDRGYRLLLCSPRYSQLATRYFSTATLYCYSLLTTRYFSTGILS